jgi:DNA modification methylase
MSHTLHLGDCLDVLRTLPDCSVDAVVTDPPYGFGDGKRAGFMGKRWDYDVPSVAIWAECLRVLKPGGHLLAFAGTRTQHRMAVRIEDAGFEIRDMIAWVYGSGFPKSLDVSKAIDKAAGAEREVMGKKVTGRALGGSNWRDGDAGGQETVDITAPATPEAQQWAGWGTALKPSIETVTWATKPFPPEGERAKILGNLWKIEARLWLLSSASVAAQSSTSSQSEYGAACATAQWTADDATNTRAALRGLMDTWQCEMATYMSLSIVSSWRRTLEESSKPGSTSTTETESKTTTDWKTLSFCLSQITPESIIQACSLPGGFSANASTAAQIFNASLALLQATHTLSAIEPATWQALDDSQGEAVRPTLNPVVMARKPLAGTVAANVLEHGTGAINVDGCRVGSEELRNPAAGNKPGGNSLNMSTVGMPQDAAGTTAVGRWPANLIHDGSDEAVGLFPQTAAGGYPACRNTSGYSGGLEQGKTLHGAIRTDTGSAARFFYTAKASKDDRDGGNTHPTVKPTDLMRYLCRLVTPPGGVVLDPFMGSGSTGKAAMLEGFGFIGIEREAAYHAIAEQRISRAAAAGHQPDLFSLAA